MKLNIPLLRKVQKRILKSPERFDMMSWVYRDDECGVACIAGHVLFESGYQARQRVNLLMFRKDEKWCPRIEETAARLLGIDRSTADSLFRANKWPETLRRAYEDSIATPSSRAFIAAARIEHLINHHA